jgi:hypothetical protein
MIIRRIDAHKLDLLESTQKNNEILNQVIILLDFYWENHQWNLIREAGVSLVSLPCSQSCSASDYLLKTQHKLVAPGHVQSARMNILWACVMTVFFRTDRSHMANRHFLAKISLINFLIKINISYRAFSLIPKGIKSQRHGGHVGVPNNGR